MIANKLNQEVKTSEQLISEPLTPVVTTSDTSRMATGEPGLPREFLWRGQTIRITAVTAHLARNREMSPRKSRVVCSQTLV